MRHRKKRGKLSRSPAHRKALLKSLSRELFLRERITTTLEKAKAVRPEAEKLITLARKGGLANYRRALSRLDDKAMVKKLFDDIGPRFAEREGGYTRIIRLPGCRLGDNGSKAILELVEKAEGKDDGEQQD